MKSKTLKLLRIAPRLRREVESVLAKGETLSAFIFDSVARNVGFRRTQQLFIARGLASGERARKTGRYVPADAVISKLSSRLTKAHAKSAPDGYTLLMAQPAFTVIQHGRGRAHHPRAIQGRIARRHRSARRTY